MYFVKSKGRQLKLRDAESGEMRDVGPRAWVTFGLLPANMSGAHDCDFDVRAPRTQEELSAIEAENAQMADEDSRRRKEPAPVAAEPQPEVEAKSRRRR